MALEHTVIISDYYQATQAVFSHHYLLACIESIRPFNRLERESVFELSASCKYVLVSYISLALLKN